MFLWGHLLKEILAFLMYVPAERTNEAHFFTSTRLICYNSLIVWGPTDKVSFDYISVARSCSWPCVGLVSSITWKWMWRLWGGPVMVILLDFRMLLTICNTNELSAGGEITLWSYLINAGIKNKRTCGEAQMWLRGAKRQPAISLTITRSTVWMDVLRFVLLFFPTIFTKHGQSWKIFASIRNRLMRPLPRDHTEWSEI